jgi:hypothetical protein
MDKMVNQLKSQKLTKTELAAAARSMPFLDRIQMDPKELTTLSNQAAAQGPAQGYGPAPGYEDWRNSTRYPQDSTTFRRPQQDVRGQQGTQGQGQTQQRAPIIRTDFTAFHDGVVLQDSDEIWADWEDCYQVQPTNSVTPRQQHPQTYSTPRDSRTTRTTVKQQQAPPQEKNVRPGDYVQIMSRPTDKTAEARKKDKSSDPWRRL